MSKQFKQHYNKETGADPFELFRNMEGSGDCLLDFLRMDIIKRCFRLTKKGTLKDALIDIHKILDEASTMESIINKAIELRNHEEMDRLLSDENLDKEIKESMDKSESLRKLAILLQNNIPF